MIICFENLDTSHLLLINGFWHIRFHVSAIWKFAVFRAKLPIVGRGRGGNANIQSSNVSSSGFSCPFLSSATSPPPPPLPLCMSSSHHRENFVLPQLFLSKAPSSLLNVVLVLDTDLWGLAGSSDASDAGPQKWHSFCRHCSSCPSILCIISRSNSRTTQRT